MFFFGTPKSPPRTEDGDLSVLRLIRSRRVGPTTFHRLLAEHGSAAAALDALPGVAAAAGLAGYAVCPADVARAEIRRGEKAGARLLTWASRDYPAALREIEDAPPVLWIKGDAACLTRPRIAVIGARTASSMGIRMAHGMAGALGAAGQVVVAGLARGIDTAAHESTLDTGTIAVMAGGIDVIYPRENAALAERICARGLLMTEQPPGLEPVARHFPARNRIISGLSAGVVVVEAAVRSGSLLTARTALDQGREVMAVPGHPMDGRASGGNALIRDGATLVRNADDVLTTLGIEPVARYPLDSADQTRLRDTARRRAEAARVPVPAAVDAGMERRVLELLGPSPTDEEMLLHDLGITAAMLAPVMLGLELEGRVERLPGNRLARLA